MVDGPTPRTPQAGLEAVTRRPSELSSDLRGVDGVAAIVAGAIGDERLERAPGRACGMELVDRVADSIHDFDVGPLVAAADIVLFADAPAREDQQQTGAVILHVQPIADVAAVPVDRQRPP